MGSAFMAALFNQVLPTPSDESSTIRILQWSSHLRNELRTIAKMKIHSKARTVRMTSRSGSTVASLMEELDSELQGAGAELTNFLPLDNGKPKTLCKSFILLISSRINELKHSPFSLYDSKQTLPLMITCLTAT
jgi:hypothetical protein